MNNKQWYYRLLFSYMPALFIVSSIAVLAALIGFSERVKEEAVLANETFSQQVIQFLDYSLRNIDLSMIKESQSGGQFAVFFELPLDHIARLDDYMVSKKIKDYMVNNPLIDSMYLYRSADNLVLSHAWTGSLANYPDRSFVEGSMEQRTPFRWTPQREFREFPEVEADRNVVSLVRKVGDEGLVVVNVNPKNLQSLLEERFSRGKNENTFGLFDQKGQKLLAIAEQASNSNSQQNGAEALSTSRSDYTGFEIHGSVKHMEIFRIVTSVSLIWLLIIAGSMIVGVLWIFYVTRYNYRPLQSIVKRIEAFSKAGDERNRSLDEFKYIDHALENLMYSSNIFQKEHEENLHYKRQILYEELLEGSRIITSQEWQEELQEFGMSPKFDHLAVLIFDIDKYDDFCNQYSHRDQHLFKYVVHNVLQEISGDQSLRLWTEWLEPHQLSGICLLEGDDLESCQGNLIRLAEIVRDWVQNHLQFTVTVSIGMVVQQIGDLSVSYDEGLNALKYKLAMGRNRVIPSWNVTSENPGEMFKYLQAIRSMVQAYRLGEDKWEQELADFFELLRISSFRKEDITGLIHYFIYNMYRNLMELSKEYQVLWLDHTLPQLNESLERFDDLQEIHVHLHTVLKETFREMYLLRENRSQYGVSMKICSYIEEHYMNPDLSLNHLSEAFGYHANYLSKVFKVEIGERFLEYLARVRVEHAKKMLETTTITVQEVAVQVGYTHTFSFMRVFKKLVGMPPGEYRKDLDGSAMQ